MEETVVGVVGEAGVVGATGVGAAAVGVAAVPAAPVPAAPVPAAVVPLLSLPPHAARARGKAKPIQFSGRFFIASRSPGQKLRACLLAAVARCTDKNEDKVYLAAVIIPASGYLGMSIRNADNLAT
jgi:hypothetical protein